MKRRTPSPALPSLASLLAVLSLASLLLSAGTASAQVGGGPIWVALDQSPAGSPPSVVFDGRSSNATKSFFDVFVHGFYMEPKSGPGGTQFTLISSPETGETGQTGAPNLPAVMFRLAVPQGIQSVHLASVSIVSGTEFFPPDPCWPRTVPEMDDVNGTPEQFVQDPAIYGMTTPWPPMDGDALMAATSKLGIIMGANVKVYPFHYTPVSNLLTISTHMRIEYDHDGTPVVSPQITRRAGREAVARFQNWGVVGPNYPLNPIHYNGYYLIICQNGWKPSLQDLIDQKSARGFWVDIDYIPATGNTCDGIRTLIANWYNSTPHEADHYCLLCGQTDVIPYCAAPVTGNPPTDDLYGSVGSDDLDKEVHVGRLSTNAAGLAYQEVQKIIKYMDHPPSSNNYVRALLVAHAQDAPGKYEGCMESVRLGSYSSPPSFVRIYGSDPLVSDATVTNEITAGAGLVCYRGHGSSDGWAAWNGFGEWYSTTNVSLLTNTVTPVVWNIACSNHDLPFADCLGEWWLGRYPYGGVSSYGATVPSNTDENHEIARQLFDAVYDLGLTTQSLAIEYAEAQASALVREYNAWLYLLLGDPEMPIRRDNVPPPWAIFHPTNVQPCLGNQCSIGVSVLDSQGRAVPNAQVSLWKRPPGTIAAQGAAPAPGRAGMAGVQATGDDVFDNRYTDSNGAALIPAAPTTPGMIYLTVQDDFGNSQLDSIPVVSPAGVSPSEPAPFRFTAAPTVARGWTRFQFGRALDQAATIVIMDVTGRRVRTLTLAPGETTAEWRADDDAGRALRPGLYLARFQGDGRIAMARVAILR